MTPTTAAEQALAAEYAAVYGYGVVGAHLDGAARGAAGRAEDWHLVQQGVLSAAVTEAGGTPPAPEAAYTLPFAVTSATAARRLAAQLEDGVAAAYADLVQATSGSARSQAALSLGACAVRAATWRLASQPLPGVPEWSGG